MSINVGIGSAKFHNPYQSSSILFSVCDDNEEFESDDVSGVCGVAGC